MIQILHLKDSAAKVPLLAAVGPLQFEVVQYRLESEYGAASRLEAAPWTVVRWLPPELKEEELDNLQLPTGSRLAFDSDQNPVRFVRQRMVAELFQPDESQNRTVRPAAQQPADRRIIVELS